MKRQQAQAPPSAPAPARQRTLDAFLPSASGGANALAAPPPPTPAVERGHDGSAFTVCPGCGERIALAYAKVHIDAECLVSPTRRGQHGVAARTAAGGAWGVQVAEPTAGGDDDAAFLAACEAACVQAESDAAGSGEVADIEELADGRSPLQRWRRRGLFVTDLTAQSWCEAQLQANLSSPARPVETAAMKAGTLIHDAVEAELHVRVPIAAQSREDGAAVVSTQPIPIMSKFTPRDRRILSDRLRFQRLLNMLLMLEELRTRGITRELPLFGVVHSDDVARWQSAQPGSSLPAGRSAESLGLPEYVMIWGIADEIRRELPPQPSSQAGAVIDLTSSQPEEIFVLHELKTRQRHCMPSDAQARGTALQLSIYKQLW